VLQARLTGALKAVDTLRDRAPEVAKRVWGEWAVHAAPNLLDREAQSWIEGVVAELLHVEQHGRPSSHVDHLDRLIKQSRPQLRAVLNTGVARRRKVKV
jgi:hypothetical protein